MGDDLDPELKERVDRCSDAVKALAALGVHGAIAFVGRKGYVALTPEQVDQLIEKAGLAIEEARS